MPKERGVIYFRDRQKQINDFRNLKRMSNITPIDIDGFIDYRGKNFIYLEGKLNGADLPNGQRLALENAVISHCDSGHDSIAIVYEHWIPSHLDVDVANCRVKKIFHRQEGKYSWWENEGDHKVIDLVERFEKANKIV